MDYMTVEGFRLSLAMLAILISEHDIVLICDGPKLPDSVANDIQKERDDLIAIHEEASKLAHAEAPVEAQRATGKQLATILREPRALQIRARVRVLYP